MNGVMSKDRRACDMVQVNLYGDERWYLGYLSQSYQTDNDLWMVDVYSQGETKPNTYCVPPGRLALLW